MNAFLFILTTLLKICSSLHLGLPLSVELSLEHYSPQIVINRL